jgi:hypothetical protein
MRVATAAYRGTQPSSKFVFLLPPRLMLHDLCAFASGESASAGTIWSACQGSLGRSGSPQIQQGPGASRTSLARLR